MEPTLTEPALILIVVPMANTPAQQSLLSSVACVLIRHALKLPFLHISVATM